MLHSRPHAFFFESRFGDSALNTLAVPHWLGRLVGLQRGLNGCSVSFLLRYSSHRGKRPCPVPFPALRGVLSCGSSYLSPFLRRGLSLDV